jgi:hypothetical protein
MSKKRKIEQRRLRCQSPNSSGTAEGQGRGIVTETKKPMPDPTKMTQEELKKWQQKKMKEYREWEDSFEGISYSTDIECPVGYDDALVIQVLHDIPRRYRIRAQEFRYFVLSDVKGFTLPVCFPGGDKNRTSTFILLNLSHRTSKKDKMTTIAHEIAHGVLNHGSGGRENERAADDLCEKWGFGRAYKSYEQFRS